MASREGPKVGATLDVKSLESWLWDAACQIRDRSTPRKFKDYILPLIFLKRLSDVFDDDVSESVTRSGTSTPHATIIDQDHALVRFDFPPREPLVVPCSKRPSASAKPLLTPSVQSLVRTRRLQGVIDTVDFNATTAGSTTRRQRPACGAGQDLGQHRLGLRDVEPDLLGRALRIPDSASSPRARDKAQASSTRQPAVARLMARILDPQPGMTVYDPCCGSAQDS